VETSLAAKPKRGEIWLVNLDPTIGSEIKKTRPAVIISSDSVGILPVRLIAPITGWDDRYSGNIWHILITSDTTNNLSKPSAVDVLQVRGVDTARLVHRIGKLGQKTMRDITEALAAVVEG
jgi:mRNA interferase MazF